jgi:RNA polymerase sigma-70 factor (ECF subfamily)
MTPRALRSPSRMKVNATAKEAIVPSTPNTIDNDFASFLAGDSLAGAALYARLRRPLLRKVRRHAPDLPDDIAEDAVTEVFVLMMENRAAFNPARGSAQAFISTTLVPEAVRHIRAENARPGAPKRQRKPTAKVPLPTVTLDEVPETAMRIVGYGSPEAMEAACDAHVIWSRATPLMRQAIDGLMDGKAQVVIASEMKVDRFKVARMIKTLRQFACAA